MALQPSRRIPRAFQRRVSPLSRRLARRFVMGGKKKRRWKDSLPRMARHWRRMLRSFHGSMSTLKLWLLSLGIASIIGLALFFLFSSAFTIHAIRVSREDRRVDVEEIQLLLAPIFGRHILFVSPVLVARDIQEAFPEISSATVRRVFPNELHVRIQMDEIAAKVFIGEPDDTEITLADDAFNGASPAASTGATLYRYMSAQGIYLEYPLALEEHEQRKPLPLYFVDWAVKPAHRQKVLDSNILESMQQVRGILEQSFGDSVSSITVYLRAREFHVVTVHPGRPPGHETLALWFDQASPVLEQINRYREFLGAVSPVAATDYVDLRLHDRVVYR